LEGEKGGFFLFRAERGKKRKNPSSFQCKKKGHFLKKGGDPEG